MIGRVDKMEIDIPDGIYIIVCRPLKGYYYLRNKTTDIEYYCQLDAFADEKPDVKEGG
jgi:hypothetical protein